MLEEERSWRLAESIGIVAKSAEMAQGSAKSTIIEHLISLTGGLPAGKDRVDAHWKSISSRVPERHLRTNVDCASKITASKRRQPDL